VSIGSISGEELVMVDAAAAAAASRQVGGRTVPVAGSWAVDPAHSSFEFIARHMMAKVRGRFTEFTANV
jgi:polyisoprenoid-binding protein YceI